MEIEMKAWRVMAAPRRVQRPQPVEQCARSDPPITGAGEFDQLVAEFGVGQWQFRVALAVGLEVD